MIVQLRNKELVRIYKCPICGGIFQSQMGDTMVSCCVLHPPGTCCHFAERAIASDVLDKILALIKDAPFSN